MPYNGPIGARSYERAECNENCRIKASGAAQSLLGTAVLLNRMAAPYEVVLGDNGGLFQDYRVPYEMMNFRCEFLGEIANLVAPEKCPDVCVAFGMVPGIRTTRVPCE